MKDIDNETEYTDEWEAWPNNPENNKDGIRL
jgi:hypothetical protein